MKSRFLIGVASGCVTGVIAAPALAQQTYEIEDLAQLAGASFALATGINESAKVTGWAVFGDPSFEAPQQWADHQAFTPTALAGDNRAATSRLNDSGIAVGLSSFRRIEQIGHQTRIYDTQRACIWDALGNPTDLNDLVSGGDTTLHLLDALDIANDARVVGYGRTGDAPNPWRAYRFENGIVTTLPSLRAPAVQGITQALGTNSAGEIVGVSDSPYFPQDNGHAHAVVWRGGQITDLHHTPGITGLASHAWDINDNGWIVGNAQFNVSHPEEPCIWRDGQAVLLPNLGFWQGDVFAINNRNEAVGITFTPEGSPRAVMWRDDQVIDLTPLIPQDQGWEFLTHAFDINERGEIAGWGKRNGLWDQAFILRPTGPCRADFDGDGFVTGLDFDAFVAAFEEGGPEADFNGDGFVTGQDFDEFVGAFEDGC